MFLLNPKTPMSPQEYALEIHFEKHCPSSDGVSALFSGPIKELLQFICPPALAPAVAMSFVLNEFF